MERICLITIIVLMHVITLSAEKIIVGADRDYPPFSFFDEKGNPAGYDIDFFNYLADHLGLEPEYHLDTWYCLQEQAKAGEIGILLGTIYTKERNRYLDFSVPYNHFNFVLIVPRNSAINQPADLEGLKLATLRGDAAPGMLLQNQEITVTEVEYDTLTKALKGLLRHEADFMIVPKAFAQNTLWANQYAAVSVLDLNVFTSTYRLAVAPGYTDLLPDINSFINRFLGSEYSVELDRKWFPESSRNTEASPIPFYQIYTLLGGMALIIFLFLFIFHRFKLRMKHVH